MVANDDRNVEESAPWPHCRPVLSSHTAAGNYLEVLLLTLVVLVAALLITGPNHRSASRQGRRLKDLLGTLGLGGFRARQLPQVAVERTM